MVEDKINQKDVYPALVVKVIDDETVVINRGSVSDVRVGQEFMIYIESNEPIINPEDGLPLGYLEIPKGNGVVINVQEKMSLIESNEVVEERIMFTDQFNPFREQSKVTSKKIPFRNPKVGDKAKPI